MKSFASEERCGPPVVLIGFMGAGKTSVGRELARMMNTSFLDLDDRVVAAAGRSIAEIFDLDGEGEFRRLESEQLRGLLEDAEALPGVLALGGGAFVQTANEQVLRAAGATIVFLDASLEELERRCRGEASRPLAFDPNLFRELYRNRRPAYLRADHVVVTDGRSVEQIARDVMLLAVPSRHGVQ